MLNLPFNKLQIWQNSIDLTDLIYDVASGFPKNELYGLTSQMQRSAVSIASNIAEGSQRATSKDFAHFILTTKASLAELETQVIISHRRRLMTDQKHIDCLTRIEELHKMLYVFHKKLTTDH